MTLRTRTGTAFSRLFLTLRILPNSVVVLSVFWLKIQKTKWMKMSVDQRWIFLVVLLLRRAWDTLPARQVREHQSLRVWSVALA